MKPLHLKEASIFCACLAGVLLAGLILWNTPNYALTTPAVTDPPQASMAGAIVAGVVGLALMVWVYDARKRLERLIQNGAYYACLGLIELLLKLTDPDSDLEEFPTPLDDTPMSTLFEHDPNAESGEKITIVKGDNNYNAITMLALEAAIAKVEEQNDAKSG